MKSKRLYLTKVNGTGYAGDTLKKLFVETYGWQMNARDLGEIGGSSPGMSGE